MGYYTYFSLEVYGESDKVEKCEQDIANTVDIGQELIDGNAVEAKWYEWESVIDDIAKRNPDALIQLFGDGESSDDMWECRWYQGKKEYHEIAIPPFTEIKLPNEHYF